MYQKILDEDPRFPPYVSETARDLIRQLMQKDPSRRLGAGDKDAKEVKKHPFYAGMDWKMLLLKQIQPPYIPEVVRTCSLILSLSRPCDHPTH